MASTQEQWLEAGYWLRRKSKEVPQKPWQGCPKEEGPGFELEADQMNQVVERFTNQLSEQSTAVSDDYSRQCSEIDLDAAKVVFETTIKDAFRAVVADCQFCVTVGDPRQPDNPLIAVSDGFDTITGYSKFEMIGRNCRFLNHGCLSDPTDILALREACMTGAPFTAVVTNRRKNGELFLNLLDLRGLTVAQNPWTDEDAVPELQELAKVIRAKLVDELKAFVVAGALMTNFEGHEDLPAEAGSEDGCQDAWCILPEPQWRGGTPYPEKLSLSANPMASFFRPPFGGSTDSGENSTPRSETFPSEANPPIALSTSQMEPTSAMERQSTLPTGPSESQKKMAYDVAKVATAALVGVALVKLLINKKK